MNLLQQLKRILSCNATFVKKSWSSACSWNIGKTNYHESEILLNMNIDGAAVFTSRNFAVWPVWVEILNLPEKIKGIFSNHALVGMWHGRGKPNWDFLLKKVAIEIEIFLSNKVYVEKLGFCSFKFLFLVCDMPAKAAVCCVQQFNGYYGCPQCYIRGFHQNNRMIYKVNEPLILRIESDYLENARLKQFGVKSRSPLNTFFSMPSSVPIDPMHQVFLGAAKILSKALVAKMNSFKVEIDVYLKNCMVPFESLNKAKSIKEIKLWKAADYKLFFFHLAPLILLSCGPSESLLVECFCRLSIAVKLLSEYQVSQYTIDYAEKQINIFFDHFVALFGVNSQSFSFHSLRHLAMQVRTHGPRWLFSAFSFESANHMLLRTVSGSIKTPEKIIQNFLSAQFLASETPEKYVNTELYTKLNTESVNFAKKQGLFSLQSRYVDFFVFTSAAFTYNKTNISNSFAQLKSKKIIKIEFFAKSNISSDAIAVVHFFKEKLLQMYCTDLDKSFVYLYKLRNLGDLEIIDARELKWKCVLCKNREDVFFASVMREGFEHN